MYKFVFLYVFKVVNKKNIFRREYDKKIVKMTLVILLQQTFPKGKTVRPTLWNPPPPFPIPSLDPKVSLSHNTTLPFLCGSSGRSPSPRALSANQIPS